MLVQFYAHDNVLKVFKDRNSPALLTISNCTRSHAYSYLGFRAKSSAWTKTTWGSEIELTLVPKKK